MWPRIILAAMALILACIGATVVAQTMLEKLVSPGPLSRAHAGIEVDCGACHKAFSPAAENGQCLACHMPVASDIRRRAGFHGKAGTVARGACRDCHTEHAGRAKAIAAFDPTRFDHRRTDFMISGAHTRASCRDCHRPGAKFRAAPSSCAACHGRDDVHRGRLGKDCAACHTDRGWKPIRAFDHDRTGFPLVGRHQAVTCMACHAGQRWEATPRMCVACHLSDDVHKGSLGPNCENCHVPRGWKAVTFDHDTDTRFPLVGRHATTTCAGCHGATGSRPRPPRDCAACHQADDVHKGRNGPACADCHTTGAWTTIIFDHDRQTRFALRGAHARTACTTCHIQPVNRFKPPMDCLGCHADDDPHQGRMGTRCADCHGVEAWKRGVRFDHAITRFPLFGRHAIAACALCHVDKRFTARGVTCADCHEDRWHAGRFGKSPMCSTCHVPVGWTMWRFDHDRQTRFPLHGRHADLTCHSCHRRAATPAMDCHACHHADDIHDGRFGRNCGSCHGDDQFGTVRLPVPARHPSADSALSRCGGGRVPWRLGTEPGCAQQRRLRWLFGPVPPRPGAGR